MLGWWEHQPSDPEYYIEDCQTFTLDFCPRPATRKETNVPPHNEEKLRAYSHNIYIRSDIMKPKLFGIQIWWHQTFLLTKE